MDMGGESNVSHKDAACGMRHATRFTCGGCGDTWRDTNNTPNTGGAVIIRERETERRRERERERKKKTGCQGEEKKVFSPPPHNTCFSHTSKPQCTCIIQYPRGAGCHRPRPPADLTDPKKDFTSPASGGGRGAYRIPFPLLRSHTFVTMEWSGEAPPRGPIHTADVAT